MATSLQRFDPTSRQNRVALSLAMGALMLLAYQTMPLVRILTNAGFYVSWLASALMALAVIATVRRVLARIFVGGTTQVQEKHRFFRALLGGVLLPCLMVLGMVYGLLESVGGGFAQSGYFDREFPLVILFIVILNLTYLTLHYRSEFISLHAAGQELLASLQAKDRELADLQQRLDATEAALGEAAGKKAVPGQVINQLVREKRLAQLTTDKNAQTDDPAALLKKTIRIVDAFGDKPVALSRVVKISWSERAVWVTLDNNRTKKMRAESLRKAMDALPSYWFVRISNTTIINRKFLVEDRIVQQLRKLHLTLLLPNKEELREVVARNAVAAFRAWLANGQTQRK